MVKDRKLLLGACSSIVCQMKTKYLKQIQFWGEIFRTHFSKFLPSQDPTLKFLSILDLNCFICLL